ncbi:universal stress protein [Vagococcus intermedius]|uniref:Universal stress protein n=1 Tax=Vagococcus intermedius TaxID=2991418 RepID=A0AAF0CVE2_9ENTE|nr:universal stress protein [Vagococcus intermedius]WEG73720.1 universal stress protein [Vagococcus intermedius]WEG75805.1 universal stress protein [Vagococcus intermedius]
MVETQEYQTILVGIDGSEQARNAFDKALFVAQRNKAKVVVVHIIENRLYGNMGYSLTNADLLQQETDRSKEVLEEYKQHAIKKGCPQVETVLAFGSPKVLMAEELPQKYQADLIMVGQSGLSAVEKLMMGSVSDYVIRNAPCDVLVVRPTLDEK